MRSARRFHAAALALAVCCAARASDLPPVYLSHLYVVLDAASYDAILASPAIHALADTRQEHVEASNGAWTGTYLTAKHTYIELFSAKQPPPDSAEGQAGVGLQVEAPGGLRRVADRLRAAFGDRAKVEDEKFKLDDGRMARAFSVLELEAGKTPPAVELWVMEGDPDYLRTKHPGTRIDDPLTRLRGNAWRFRPELAMEDVTGVRIALKPDDLSELAAQLRDLGWSIEQAGNGFVARGPDIRFDVVPAGPRAGILELTLRLSRPLPSDEARLGRARLRIDGGTAHLAFWADE